MNYPEHSHGCCCGACVEALWDQASSDAALIKHLRLEIGYERAKSERLAEMICKRESMAPAPPTVVHVEGRQALKHTAAIIRCQEALKRDHEKRKTRLIDKIRKFING